jgi:hypothetical protein
MIAMVMMVPFSLFSSLIYCYLNGAPLDRSRDGRDRDRERERYRDPRDDRGGYDRGSYDRGGYDRGGYDRGQRYDDRDRERRRDYRDDRRY